jgi:hypothetical protein
VKINPGFIPLRWDPVVVERLVAPGKALGEHFDSDPNFEGVAIQETSLGLSDEDLTKFGYTSDKYGDALVAVLTGIRHHMPHSHLFWNYYYDGVEQGERSFDDAIRVIRKYPVFNDSISPSFIEI